MVRVVLSVDGHGEGRILTRPLDRLEVVESGVKVKNNKMFAEISGSPPPETIQGMEGNFGQKAALSSAHTHLSKAQQTITGNC